MMKFQSACLVGTLSWIALLGLHNTETHAWTPSATNHARISSLRKPTTSTKVSPFASNMVNGDASDSDNGGNNGGSGIIPAAMTGKSQLAAAFTALDESDQYDAVLTGLCAKLLDNNNEDSTASLEDTAALLTEMNQRQIPASPRSLMALIDATVKAQDALTMAEIVRLAIQNKNGLRQYGILQSEIVDMPASPNQRVNDNRSGGSLTRAERLANLPDVPSDDRGKEVTSALATLGVVGFCFLANLFGFDDITPLTNLVWFSIVAIGVVDNFYDVLKFGSNAVISNLNTTDTTKDNLKLPNKDQLPLGLGSGKLTGTVTAGLTRLLSVNTERECQCEAAALFAAYTLGLPCFAFRPNSLEAAYLIASSMEMNNPQQQQQNNNNPQQAAVLDPLLSTTGILKVLVWLMAPVAMESMKHPQLICSDPREASGLLKRLEDNAGKENVNIDRDSLWWTMEEDPPQETADLLKWAYHEADILIRNNLKDVTEMSQRLTGGAATIGDCVAVVEKW